MIVLENLYKNFSIKNQTIEAVSKVSLKINKGEIFGVIGYSGAGKSTLVRLINLLEKPDQGKILIDNVDLTLLDEVELRLKRQEIGMIFQQFNLLSSLTVFDNIALPMRIAKRPKEEIKKRVEELMELVKISDKQLAYPAQLSGGQKQRVGIARALANQPSILLCDEATSALDPETTRSILQLLKEINEKLNVTIIIISHEMSVIKTICDTVAVMEAGQIVEVDTVENLFLNPKHSVTKSFVSELPDPDAYQRLVTNLKAAVSGGYLLELSFPKAQSNQPLLAKIIKDYKLNVNILHGQLLYTKQGSVGQLYVHIETDKSLSDIINIFALKQIVAKEVS